MNYSQTKLETVTLNEYEITDTNLMKEIDEFILSECVCNYYSDTLKFSIDICDWNGNKHDICSESDTLSVTISSIDWDDLFYFNAVGYFSYKGHLFSISNVATKKFFKPTGMRNKFTYSDPKNIRPDDDSITYWTFKYYCGNFNLEHEKYNCPTKRK
ncbi:MAG: hypothetical protein K9J13_04405 [Saprospiraceae bacterium]|nr:hypothetical protein [Saprospiraceae bacterium]